MQLLDLENKEIWHSKFERLCVVFEKLEKSKIDISSQHKWPALNDQGKENMSNFNAWISIPDLQSAEIACVCCSFPFRFCMHLWAIIFQALTLSRVN